MKQAKIITGIDIGTSKISVVICQLKSTNDIEILGLGTSVLKNVQKGLIRDESLFVNALQNAIKRAQVASGCLVKTFLLMFPVEISALSLGQALFITNLTINH